MDTTDVGAYYATFRDREWQRLERDEGAVEFDVTAAMLTRHLPACGRILDIGGGPGRYAAWLADRGYRVTLRADDPGLLGLGGHLLYVGERRDAEGRDIDSHDPRDAL